MCQSDIKANKIFESFKLCVQLLQISSQGDKINDRKKINWFNLKSKKLLNFLSKYLFSEILTLIFGILMHHVLNIILFG